MNRSALLSLILLSGCAALTQPPQTTADIPVSELVRAHRYNSALSTLQREERDSPDYRERRRELLTSARAWQQQLLTDLDRLIESQQFAAAELQLESALPELPETPALRRYVVHFYEQRDAFVAEQVSTLTRLRGENLLREQPLYEKLRGVEGDYRVHDAVERYREDCEFFASKLRETGLLAYEAGDWSSAVAQLRMANQLLPDALTATHLAAAETKLRAVEGEEQSEQLQRERTLRSDMRSRFDSAMRAGDLASAEAVVKEASHQSDTDFSRGLQQQLTEAQRATAATDIEAGDRLYGEGKIEQALRRWQSAQRYDTSAELQMKVDRAQRLLEHYRELREQSR